MTTRDEHARNIADQQARKQARLAEKLRANLQRRKAQARSRRAGEEDARPDGLANAGAERAGDKD